MGLPLLVSAAIHALFIWAMLRQGPVQPSKELIQVEYKEFKAARPPVPAPAPTPVKKPQGRGKANKAGRSRATGRKGSLYWSQLKPDAGYLTPSYIPGPGDSAREDTSGWSPEHWGAGGGNFGEVENLLKLDKIREEVENMLNYPGALGRREIEGTVNARLVFDQNSRCNWRKTELKGAQPYFRVYVLALLKKLCSLETVEHVGFKENQVLDMSFQFEMVSRMEGLLPEEKKGRIAGNVMMFKRTFPKPILEYQLGPIRGVWFAPVVYLDWPWVVENYEKLVENKDPLRDFRE